jgi:hypothetical protein
LGKGFVVLRPFGNLCNLRIREIIKQLKLEQVCSSFLKENSIVEYDCKFAWGPQS